nr:hypothetical protein [Candidatus Sigynarchaeota archaeon]
MIFTIVKTNEIFLDFEDHAELTTLLLKKMQKEGIGLRESVIFPVTVDSSWLLNGLLVSGEGGIVRDITWMPGMDKAPVSASTKNILFLEDRVEQNASKAKHAKQVLRFLVKKFKLEKKLKDAKFYSLCWFSSSPVQDLGNSVKLLSSVYVPSLAGIQLGPATKKPAMEGSRRLGFTEAVAELKWEPDHVYKEKHEIVLEKLKSELWD